MEHENDPVPEKPEVEIGDDFAEGNSGCGKVILKLIVGGIVFFFVAVALVFGVCLLG